MTVLLFILIFFLSFILGTFGFCQIVGTIKHFDKWPLLSAFITVFLWTIVLSGAYVASYFWLNQFIWAVNIGYIVSFLLSFKTVPDENNIIDYFKRSYNKVYNLYAPCMRDARCMIDIAAVLMVVFDLAIVHNGGKSQTTFEESAKHLKLFKEVHPYAAALSHTSDDELEKRMEFYAEFIREKQPRCDFNPFIDNKSENGLLRAVFALGDIVYNPKLIDDYDNAPILITNFSDTERFTEITMNAVKEISLVFEHVQKVNW